jgi:hypothetical protein
MSQILNGAHMISITQWLILPKTILEKTRSIYCNLDFPWQVHTLQMVWCILLKIHLNKWALQCLHEQELIGSYIVVDSKDSPHCRNANANHRGEQRSLNFLWIFSIFLLFHIKILLRFFIHTNRPSMRKVANTHMER